MEGNEVEWTLGFALAEIDFRPHHVKIPVMTKNSFRYMISGKAQEIMFPLKFLGSLIKLSGLAVKSTVKSWWRKIVQNLFMSKS